MRQNMEKMLKYRTRVFVDSEKKEKALSVERRKLLQVAKQWPEEDNGLTAFCP